MKMLTHGGAAGAVVLRGTGSLPVIRQLPDKGKMPVPPAQQEFGKPQFHPLVMTFPILKQSQMDALVEDIRTRGAPVLLRRGEVVLGDFNAYKACEIAGVQLKFKEWDGTGSLAEVVARSILPAAQFDPSQRAAIAVAISDQLSSETVASGIAGGRTNLKNGNGPKTAFPVNGSVAAQCAATEDNEILLSGSVVVGDRIQLHVDHRDAYITGATRGVVKAIRRGDHPQVFIEWDLPAGARANSKKSVCWCGMEYVQILGASQPLTGSLADRASPPRSDADRLGRAAEIAAELCQVSPRYVYDARKLRDESSHLFEMVRTGQMNLSRARVAVSKLVRSKSLAVPLNGKHQVKVGYDDEMIVGDCLEKMVKLPDGSMRLAFADPPYNLGWKYDSDPTRDLLPDSRYLDWTERWVRQCVRLLAADGSIFVMIDAKWQGRFDQILRNAGLHWRNTIVWHDPFPTHTDARFQPSARFIHYFTRSPKKFTWNADAIRVPSRRDEIGDARRVHENGIVPHDVWDCEVGGGGSIPRIVGNSKERVPFEDAPPQVPALILERIILAASNAGDRVFDPVTGNGTTWKAARKLGRKFTGIERSAKYAEQARQWALAEAE